MNEIEQLRKLFVLLRLHGAAALHSSPIGNLGLNKHVLTFRSHANVGPMSWPCAGSTDVHIEYDEHKEKWHVTGHALGMEPKQQPDPKAWWSVVAADVKVRHDLYNGVLQQAMLYVERYKYDLTQFQYRLATDTSASGHMSKTPHGYVWQNLRAPKIQLFFGDKLTHDGIRALTFAFQDGHPNYYVEASSKAMYKARAEIEDYTKRSLAFCEAVTKCFDPKTA